MDHHGWGAGTGDAVAHVAAELRRLEGHWIGFTLTDGSRVDAAELVSAGHTRTSSLWVLLDGADWFVPLTTVREVWASAPAAGPTRAA